MVKSFTPSQFIRKVSPDGGGLYRLQVEGRFLASLNYLYYCLYDFEEYEKRLPE